MGQEVQVVQEKGALGVLALASGTSPATTSKEALRQAFFALSGWYGAQFQPSANAIPAWAALLGEVDPQEIAEAVLAHVRSDSRFPPSAPDIERAMRVSRAAQGRSLSMKSAEVVRRIDRGLTARKLLEEGVKDNDGTLQAWADWLDRYESATSDVIPESVR